MLILNPRTVTFGAARWEGVASVAIDRAAHATIEEWTDLGPYAALADVPEQRVRIRIVQDLPAGGPVGPVPGDQALLTLTTAPAGADSARMKLSATAVVLEVHHEVAARRPAQRTLTLAAISPDGAQDPITVEPVTG
jgi:hypothetical protein